MNPDGHRDKLLPADTTLAVSSFTVRLLIKLASEFGTGSRRRALQPRRLTSNTGEATKSRFPAYRLPMRDGFGGGS
jgi:hypothetical protein